MLLNILVEVVLILIIIGGSYYGYKKGFFYLAVRPTRGILKIGIAFYFSSSIGMFIFPLVKNALTKRIPELVLEPFSKLLSTVIAFLLLFVVSGAILAIISSVLDFIARAGIIGRINAVLGLAFACVLSITCVWAAVRVTDLILALEQLENGKIISFEGGPIYNLFKK